VKLLLSNNEIKTIHVELSTHCNAACPFCARNDYGYKTRTDFPLVSLNIDQWKRIFEGVCLKSLKRISFSGNYGDPFMCKDAEQVIDYCVERWPKVELDFSTNGGMRSPDWWKALGQKHKDNNLKIRFGIDGFSETHELHRINVPFEKVIKNAREFILGGGNATWLMIKFRHNEHEVIAARKVATQLGFRNFILKENGKDLGYVFTSDTEGYWILPAINKNPMKEPKKPEQYKPFLRHDLSDFKKQEAKWIVGDREISCTSMNNKSVYISAEAKAYPCSWTGQSPDTYKYNNCRQPIGEIENRADVVGFTKAISWFHKVRESWERGTIESGVLMNCVGCSKNSFYQET